MGTDIHFYVEHRDSWSRPWRTADTWTDKYGEGKDDVYHDESFYRGRNYDLFSILANVRNGRGFAGSYTGEGFVPMNEPRDWPDDLCPELKNIEGDIDHTPSWCTLREIMDYDWTQETAKSGVVNLEQWARWMSLGQPVEWASMISGPQIIQPDVEEVNRLASLIGDKENKYRFYHNRDGLREQLAQRLGAREDRIHTRVSWKVKYYEVASDFLGRTVPRLWRLGKPENVRCVFYFDS